MYMYNSSASFYIFQFYCPQTPQTTIFLQNVELILQMVKTVIVITGSDKLYPILQPFFGLLIVNAKIIVCNLGVLCDIQPHF